PQVHRGVPARSPGVSARGGGGGSVRVGVVGTGVLGFHHARVLRSMPGVEFAGIYDIDPTRAAPVARQLETTAHPSRAALAVRAAVPYLDEPRFLQIDRLAPFQPRGTDVAVILDLMIHDLDLVLELVRAEVVDVRAMGVPLLSPHVDIANARLEFANGAIANLTASRVSRERSRKLRMFQSTGYFSLDLAQGTGDFYRLRPGWPTLGATRLEAIVEHVQLAATEAGPL